MIKMQQRGAFVCVFFSQPSICLTDSFGFALAQHDLRLEHTKRTGSVCVDVTRQEFILLAAINSPAVQIARAAETV